MKGDQLSHTTHTNIDRLPLLTSGSRVDDVTMDLAKHEG